MPRNYWSVSKPIFHILGRFGGSSRPSLWLSTVGCEAGDSEIEEISGPEAPAARDKRICGSEESEEKDALHRRRRPTWLCGPGVV